LEPIRLPEVHGVNTRSSLEHILGSFGAFDEKMAEGTKARLNKDKSKVAEMAKETERLTLALAEQVNVRREMNGELQRLCEARLQACYSEFDSLVASKSLRVSERLDALDERISCLDEHFEGEKKRIHAEIEERHKELMEMLGTFRQLFKTECEVRSEREAAIKAEMVKHDADVEARFEAETAARDEVINRLRHELGVNMGSRRMADVHLAAFVNTELQAVRSSLGQAIEVREAEDDRIEVALSTYTAKLQTSLHALNSSTD